jgi:hypothetical protein
MAGWKYGVVSSKAVSRVRMVEDNREYFGTGTGPVGAVGSDAINSQGDGTVTPGGIDNAVNAKQWQVRARAKDPFRKSTWSPSWFDKRPYDWAGDWKGPEADARQVIGATGSAPRASSRRGLDTGTSALDRSRRGGS